jgi:quinolinate synthase
METTAEQILRLKKERKAVILAHYYQPGEIQELADYVGDSLDLCRRSADADAEVIIFCGVRFMAETAALFNPGRLVIHPEPDAGCPMADMIEAEDIRAWKKENPSGLVVCYVNSTTGTKTECDIACTSSNALKVVASLPKGKPVLFVPDRHLGSYVNEKGGYAMELWDGFCPTHLRILPRDVELARAAWPEAAVAVHPECPASVRQLADFCGSTGQIIEFCGKTDKTTILIGTENGIIHPLQKRYPGKRFLPIRDDAVCPNMKKITAAKVLKSLETLGPSVTIPEEHREKALRPIKRMLELP